MDADLTAVLRENNVKEETAKFLCNVGCVKTQLFAHWLNDNSEIADFMYGIDAAEDDVSQRAALRFVAAKIK